MKEYSHKDIEEKWQKIWEGQGLYTTKDYVEGKENFYNLVEFPYPSGNLHIGHWYAFAVPDIFVRFKRMNGYNVLFPIGFDSFGLPAENAAIKRSLDPREWTYSNIDYMRNQFKSMGSAIDWTREVRTSDPEYYKWTQWFFAQFFEHDLAYRGEAEINWCPSCKTVLANEQVVSGRCERCDNLVEKKTMKQWMLRITKYADRLIDDLKDLPWPEEIKQSQINWIGRSEGAEFDFQIDGSSEVVTVFTTRPDTLYGVTYVVLAPEHPLIDILKDKITNGDEVERYVNVSLKKEEIERMAEHKEKTGVALEGITVVHPATGERIPLYVADYVLGSYGTGAVMAVPAHDERDYAFAQKYDLSIKHVVLPHRIDHTNPPQEEKKTVTRLSEDACDVYTGEGVLFNSKEFDDSTSTEAREQITEKYGRPVTKYKLRDWSIGRQRYWGCPIPIVYDPLGNPHTIPKEHLPWTLPTDVDYKPTGEPPLARSQELKERTERIFGKGWTPEVETMDTFVDSSWYYLRYLDPSNDDDFASTDKQDKWMPVHFYSGGAEHTTMHLLYSRFYYKALYDLGLVTAHEPYMKRMNRGLILGPDGQKMSKSRGNVIDPDEQVRNVGADSVRMYLAFIGPYNEVGTYPWDMGGIVGVRRFLERVWYLQKKVQEEVEISDHIDRLLHMTIKKVTEDISVLKFNTAIGSMMSFVNALYKEESISSHIYETLLLLLAPFAPYMAEELWHDIGNTDSIHKASWPLYDESKLVSDTVTMVIQVNGKVRSKIEVEVDRTQEEVELKSKKQVAKWLEGKDIKKVIFVQNRLINFVIV